MGVCYVLACKDCKKRLDLNKNKAIADLWYGNRTEHTHDIQDSFRFMRRHWGHNVDLTSDCAEGNDYGYYFNYPEEFGK